MADVPKNGLLMAGAIVALLGVGAMAVPVFTTARTTEVAHIGDLKLNAQEQTTHFIPPILGQVALGIGLLLMAAGYFARR